MSGLQELISDNLEWATSMYTYHGIFTDNFPKDFAVNLEYISGPTNLSAKPKVSFVTSYIYNAFMNEVELPFS